MGFGDIPLGSDARVRVGANDPPDLLVGGATSWGFSTDYPTKDRKYYNGMPGVSFVGDPTDGFDIGCDITVNDDGQKFLFAQAPLKTKIWLEMLPNGADGFKQNVRVSHTEGKASGVDDPTTSAFQFARVADPIIVGTGLG